MEIKLVVKKAFKYGAREYQPGDEWEPQGGKFDAEIIKHYVRNEIVKTKAEVKHDEKKRKIAVA